MQELIIDVSDIEVLWYGTVCQIVWRKLSHCSCLKEIEMCCSTVIYWLYIVEHKEVFCMTPLYLSMIHHSGKHQLNKQIWFRCWIQYYQYKIRQHKKSCNWFVYWFSNSVHRLFWHWNLQRPGILKLIWPSESYLSSIFCILSIICIALLDISTWALLACSANFPRSDYFRFIFFPFLSSSFPLLACRPLGVTSGWKLALIFSSL